MPEFSAWAAAGGVFIKLATGKEIKRLAIAAIELEVLKLITVQSGTDSKLDHTRQPSSTQINIRQYLADFGLIENSSPSKLTKLCSNLTP